MSSTRLPNTVVDVTVGVSTSGKDLVTVQRSLADSSNALTKYLQGQQVQRLITTSVSFAPQIKSDRSGPDKTLGYRGSSRVSFRATPEKIADLLAGVMSNGANRIIGTEFTPTEDEVVAARRRLIAEATQDAISKAETIAKAAGLHIVSVRTITENSGTNFPGSADKAMRNGYSGFMGGQLPPKSIDEASGDSELSMETQRRSCSGHGRSRLGRPRFLPRALRDRSNI